MRYYSGEKLLYVVTRNVAGDTYTLFKAAKDNKLTKICTADTPIKFKEVYPD